jgi:hypothetical protein
MRASLLLENQDVFGVAAAAQADTALKLLIDRSLKAAGESVMTRRLPTEPLMTPATPTRRKTKPK